MTGYGLAEANEDGRHPDGPIERTVCLCYVDPNKALMRTVVDGYSWWLTKHADLCVLWYMKRKSYLRL